MNRLLVVAGLMLLSSCFKAKIESAQKQLDELKATRATAMQEVQQAQTALDAVDHDVAGLQAAKVTALRNIFLVESNMVQLWKGHEPTMRKVIAKTSLPSELVPAAEHAQQSAGGETLERTLARALSDENTTQIASLLSGWETRAGVSVREETQEAEETCKLPEPKPACALMKGSSDIALCSDEVTHSQWLFRVENGVMHRSRLPDPDENKTEVTARLSPTLVLLEGTGKIDIEEGPPMRRWVDVVQFSGDKLARKARWPLRVGDGAGVKMGTLLVIDVDGDGRDDVVHAFGDRLHGLREVPRSFDVEELKPADICAKLKAANKINDGFAVACAPKPVKKQ